MVGSGTGSGCGGPHWMRISLPGAPLRMSWPGPPMSTSSPAPPIRVSSPSPPVTMSSPSPPSAVSWIAPAASPDASITSSPASPLMMSGLEAGDVHPGAKTQNRDAVAVADDLDHVIAAGRVDDDRIRRTVACTARRRQVDVDFADVGSGQVVDRDGVGASEGLEVDLLDVVEVHGDAGDVAGEQDPPAIGRDVDFLIDVGAVR